MPRNNIANHNRQTANKDVIIITYKCAEQGQKSAQYGTGNQGVKIQKFPR